LKTKARAPRSNTVSATLAGQPLNIFLRLSAASERVLAKLLGYILEISFENNHWGICMGKQCPYCHGSGKCKRCSGFGKIVGIIDVECGICHGSGKCAACDGTGEML